MRRIAKEEYFRYFPISDRQRVWDLYVAGVGRIVRAYRGTPDRGHPMPYFYVWETGRVLDQYGLIYVTQGQGEFESGATQRTVVDAGTLFLLLPGVWHRYRPCEQVCWSYYWVHVGGGYLDRLVERRVLSAERPIFKAGLLPNLLRPYASLIEAGSRRTAGLPADDVWQHSGDPRRSPGSRRRSARFGTGGRTGSSGHLDLGTAHGR